MSQTVDTILSAALLLPAPTREELVARLIQSLEHESESPLSPEWAVEVRHRMEAYRRGELAATPADEVMRSLLPEKRS